MAKKKSKENQLAIAAIIAIVAIVFLSQLAYTGHASMFRDMLRGGEPTLKTHPVCGNGVCEPPKETSTMCPEDCHFGDGVCQPQYGENNNNIPQDCWCGDGVCASPETPATCQTDCYSCGDGICAPAEMNNASSAACAQDCPYLYNDGSCDADAGESATDSRDCAVCGDGICTLQILDPGYVENCAQDCPCNDTDGGENIKVKGTCTDFRNTTGTDGCITIPGTSGPGPTIPPEVYVVEWYCKAGTMGNIKKGTGSGICTSTSIYCPTQHCVNGACINVIETSSRHRINMMY